MSMIRRVINRIRRRDWRATWSQCGEDVIVDFVLQIFGVQKPRYLDIGAYHPTKLSNTYGMYRRGCSGVLIEPNPVLYEAIRRKRPRDTVLNCGVGITAEREAPFYV